MSNSNAVVMVTIKLVGAVSFAVVAVVLNVTLRTAAAEIPITVAIVEVDCRSNSTSRASVESTKLKVYFAFDGVLLM